MWFLGGEDADIPPSEIGLMHYDSTESTAVISLGPAVLYLSCEPGDTALADELLAIADRLTALADRATKPVLRAV